MSDAEQDSHVHTPRAVKTPHSHESPLLTSRSPPPHAHSPAALPSPSPFTPAPLSPAVPPLLDMTLPASRYKLRACLTCLAQVRALLHEIQAQPEPLRVPEEYQPLRSLGDDEDVAPRDMLTTPRPLRNVAAAGIGGGTRSAARHSPATPAAGRFADAEDRFPSEMEDELAARLRHMAELEDGRTTALEAVAARAQHDPRLATVQGLLQHVDQLALTDGQEHTISSYPPWLAPQMSQVLGLINSMYPTPARAAADKAAAERSEAFRAAVGVEEEALGQRDAFELFLQRSMASARKRQERIQALSELKEAGDNGAASTRSVSPAHSGVVTPARRPGDGVGLGELLHGEEVEDEEEDPFAESGDENAKEVSRGRPAPNTQAFPHDERARQQARSESLRALTPRSRKQLLQSDASLRSTRDSAVKATTHRPAHAKPFGWASGTGRKKIGDAPEPVKPSPAKCQLDASQRAERVAALYAPRKSYAIPVHHPRKEETASPAGRKGAGKLKRGAKEQSGRSEAERERAHEADELADEASDDDPFAEDSAPRTADPASRSSTRPHSSPSKSTTSTRKGEGKKQASAASTSRPPPKASPRTRAIQLLASDDEGEGEGEGPESAATRNEDDDDPFAVHDQDAPPAPQSYATRSASKPRSRAPPSAAKATASAARSRSSAAPSNRRPASATATPTATRRPASAKKPSAAAATPTASLSIKGRGTTRTISPTAPTGKRTSVSRGASTPSSPKTSTHASSSMPHAAGPLDPASSSDPVHTAHSSLQLHRAHPPSMLPTLSSPRPLFDESAPGSWQDVELKLAAMGAEIRELRERPYQSGVHSETLRGVRTNLSESRGADAREPRPAPSSHSHAASLESESGTLTTGQWESVLEQQRQKQREHRDARSDPSIQSVDEVTTGTPAPASLSAKRHPNLAVVLPHSPSPSGLGSLAHHHQQQHSGVLPSPPHTSADALSSTRSALSHLQLEKEKRELEQALAVLQKRDEAHAQSLFFLMDKLNQLGAAGGAGAAAGVQRQQQRSELATAAFIAPFGSPLSATVSEAAAAAALRHSFPLGTPEAHGTRSLRPRTISEEVEPTQRQQQQQQHPPVWEESKDDSGQASKGDPAVVESGEEDPFEAHTHAAVEQLRAPAILADGRSSAFPTLAEQRAVQQERKAHATRLLSLEHELSQARAANSTLREQLDRASFQSDVLSRTAEAQKAFLSQSMRSSAEAEAAKEAARVEAQTVAAREGARKLAQSEALIDALRREVGELRRVFEADRAALENEKRRVEVELMQQAETQEREREEAAQLRARLEQLEADQSALSSSPSLPTRHGRTVVSHPFSPSGLPLPPVTEDFVQLVASSFVGDYLHLRAASAITHMLEVEAQRAHARGEQGRVEETVLFSDYATKYNRKNAGQPRVVLLTGQALYVLSGAAPGSLTMRRRIALCHLVKVGLSRLCAELLVVHPRHEHDLLLATQKRPELLYHMQGCFAAISAGRTPLPYEISERMYVRDRDGRVRDVSVIDSGRFKLGKAFAVEGMRV